MAISNVSALEGNELADDYVRTAPVPKGRWSDTWDIFKSNFKNLIFINLLVFLFTLPAIAVVVFGQKWIEYMCTVYPGAPVTPPYTTRTTGVYEGLVLTYDMMFYAILIVAGFIASVGISGGAYSVKRIINTHGQFSFKGFFHGVKVCYFNTVLPVTLVLLFVFASVAVSDWSALQIARGADAGGPVTAKVFMIIATVVVGVISCWILAVGVSYKVKLLQLFKHSLALLIGTIIQTVFMLGFALIPVWLLLIFQNIVIMAYIVYVIFIIFGFSFMLLCWFAFTQWAFDLFITPAIKSEEEAARAMMTPQQLEMAKQEEERSAARELIAAGRSELIGKPIKPIGSEISVSVMGTTFSRGDIKRVSEERAKLDGDIKKYYDEHINDTRYAEYNRMFAEREKALQPTDKKGRKKKLSSDNLLK